MDKMSCKAESDVVYINLYPVCANRGDAIFITVDYKNGDKEFYIVDGAIGTQQLAAMSKKKPTRLEDLLRQKPIPEKTGKTAGIGVQYVDDHEKQSLQQSISFEPISLEPQIITVDCEKLKALYDKLVKSKYKLMGIVVTHPDVNHYGGIQYLLHSYSKSITCPVLLTNQYIFRANNEHGDKFNHATGNPNHLLKCLESTHVGYEIPIPQSIAKDAKDKQLKFPKWFEFIHRYTTLVQYKRSFADSRLRPKPHETNYLDNETSIITNLFDPTNDSQILATLTGDACLCDKSKTKTLCDDFNGKQMSVFLVPRHGSKESSDRTFYEKIAEHTQYYLISCGNSYHLPDQEVLSAICEATVDKKRQKKPAIVLTNGKYLNGKKMTSFNGSDNEPELYYWDEEVYQMSNCDLITQPFLHFSLYPLPQNLTLEKHLLEWSISGFRNLATNACFKSNCIQLHISTLVNKKRQHLIVINDKLELEKCECVEGNEKNISVIRGLPTPTSPCTWENKVLMLCNTENSSSDLIFLQLLNAAKMPYDDEILKDKVRKGVLVFKCLKVPWQIVYVKINGNLELQWPHDHKYRSLMQYTHMTMPPALFSDDIDNIASKVDKRHAEDHSPVISLRPVCVNWGDAIFITVEDGERKDAYLVDGSGGTVGPKGYPVGEEITNDKERLRIAYAKITHEGFKLQRIIVTHPDKDHYGGIHHILDLESRKEKSLQIILTDRFDKESQTAVFRNYKYDCVNPPFTGNEIAYEVIPNLFSMEHKSLTAKLVLHGTETKNCVPSSNIKIAASCNNDDDDNASSIITTIFDTTNNNKILACLTGDAYFNKLGESYQGKDILVFQVPHHGSNNNSKQKFYKAIAENTTYYLISCGTHKNNDHPHKDVLKAIRKATVTKKKRAAAIVLTNGKYLTSEKMSSFNGDPLEPTIYYWDWHLYREGYLTEFFLQFNLHPKHELVINNRLIEWSIKSYQKIVPRYVKRRKDILLCCKFEKKYLMVPKDGEIQLTGHKAKFKGICGQIPSPTSPCQWPNEYGYRNFLIMLSKSTDIIFLQESRQQSIIPEILSGHTFFLFRCHKKPWQIQYAYINSDGQLDWLKCQNNLLIMKDNSNCEACQFIANHHDIAMYRKDDIDCTASYQASKQDHSEENNTHQLQNQFEDMHIQQSSVPDVDIDSFLSSIQRKRKKIHSDGNCLFRCFSYIVKGDQETDYCQIRENLVAYMQSNQSKFVKLEPNLDKHYLEKMSKNGEWGTNTEIAAFAYCHKKKVNVATFHKKWKWIQYGDVNDEECEICLTGDHFDVVVPSKAADEYKPELKNVDRHW